MKIFLVVFVILVIIICFFAVMDRLFYSKFLRIANKIWAEAGKQDPSIVTEDDLMALPPPVASYIKISGLKGKKRISSMRISHSGSFKTGADRNFMPINGKYYLTTKKPSFCWFGKISLFPGLSVSAFDSYFNGKGHMLIKVMSLFKIADARSSVIDYSAFGRCLAEMTMAPSFFLNNQLIKWTSFNSNHAEFTITDSGLSADAVLHFSNDGTLERIVVDRYFDRGNGKATLEKFTGKGQLIKDFNGLRLCSVFDGYWNLKEGDLHYVHFIVDNVEFE